MDPIKDAPPRWGNAFHAHPTIGGVPLENLAPLIDIEDPLPVETIRLSVSPRSSHTPPTLVPVILHISSSHDGGPSILASLNVYELNDQAAITAYFPYAGRVTTVLPCQNFDEFLVSPQHTSSLISVRSYRLCRCHGTAYPCGKFSFGRGRP